MITGTIPLKFEYETTRLGRYGEVKQNVFYTPIDLANAYGQWANTPTHRRDREWDTYCDIRDCVPLGANGEIRKKRNEKRFH